jgi:two-component system sensor histidine kinase PilS (NtrC family)
MTATAHLDAPETATAAEAAQYPWRVLILMNLFRLVLSSILFAAYGLVRDPWIVGESDPELAFAALVGMLTFSCLEVVLLRQRMPSATLQTYLQFAADVIGITLLMHASGGISSGMGGLLIVSVGALGLMVPTDRAFLLAALATLALLVEQSFAQLSGLSTRSQFAPAGILGAVVFVITGVVQVLRLQVVKTAALADQRRVDLRNVVELNDYIIQHLRESIVVVDGEDNVRLINESAVKHLGANAPRHPIKRLSELSEDLSRALAAWRSGSSRAGRKLSSADGSTWIRPHFAPLGQDQQGGTVIFLEDTSLIEERVQQAKLAALGRLSASIAHEIRNPIGAMSHASQLLAESSGVGTSERRLTDIIKLNSQRVSNIVESILALSRRDKTNPQRVLVAPWLDDFAREFVETLELFENSVTAVKVPADLEVLMDPTHLHQIVWNLCDNAVKYASAAAGAISVELSADVLETGRPYLDVADRGPGIEPNKVEQIFEPFYTGQPSGTGLGLYISRELAERNGATLRYYPRAGGGSVFRLVFADPRRWHIGKETE